MLHQLYAQRASVQRLEPWHTSTRRRPDYPDAERRPKRLKHRANR